MSGHRCGAETKTTDGPCEQPVDGPDARCWRHPDEGEPGNLGGRPRIELNEDQKELLYDLASIGLSREEAAKVLPMSESTLSDRLDDPSSELSGLYERARAEYHRELTNRERLIALGKADELGVEEVPLPEQRKTIKWIRKSRFGATETTKHELTGEDGGPVKTEQSVDLSQLSSEDLKLLKQLKRRASAATNGASP